MAKNVIIIVCLAFVSWFLWRVFLGSQLNYQELSFFLFVFAQKSTQTTEKRHETSFSSRPNLPCRIQLLNLENSLSRPDVAKEASIVGNLILRSFACLTFERGEKKKEKHPNEVVQMKMKFTDRRCLMGWKGTFVFVGLLNRKQEFFEWFWEDLCVSCEVFNRFWWEFATCFGLNSD